SAPARPAAAWCRERGVRFRAGSRIPRVVAVARRARVATPLHGIYGEPTLFRMTTREQPAGPRAPETTDSFRLLVESVKDYAIFMLDPAGRVASWNAGAETIKGYAAEEILGQHFSVFYTPEDLASGKPQAQLDAAVREGRVEDEGWRLRKDGQRFWADSVITALRDPAGTLVGFGKVTRDLTIRRRTEEQLSQSNSELERFSYS